MYHYTVAIQIYSQFPSLAHTLSQVPALTGFTHQIDENPPVAEVPSNMISIAIYDASAVGTELALIHQHKKKGAYTVLCATQEEMNCISAEILSDIDAVWPSPLTTLLAQFHFSKLIHHIKLEKDYKLTQSWLDTAIDSIPDLIWFKDARGSHLKVNDGFCQAVGKTKEDIQDRGHYYIWDLTPEEYGTGEYVCLETEETVLRERKTFLFDEMVKTNNGMIQLKTYKSPIFDEFGDTIGTVGIAHDVTALQNSYTEQETILRTMPFSLLLRDENDIVTNVNQQFIEYFQIEADQIVGTNYQQWEKRTFMKVTQTKLAGYFEATLSKNDERQILEIHKEAILNTFDKPAGYLCIFRNITMERQFEEKILLAANTDYLTGLYNRRSLYDFIADHEGKDAISLFYLDLDNFKAVNDTYGHEAGDQALSLLAQILLHIFPNQFISRLGGDEFLVIFLNETDTPALVSSAVALLHSVRDSFVSHDKFKGMSVSIGVVSNEDAELSMDALIHRGDKALYIAKQQGKNQVRLWSPDTV